MKKIISLALAAAVCVSVTACVEATTTNANETTGTNTPAGPGNSSQTTVITTIPGMLRPDIDTNSLEPVTVDLEGYAQLIYNPACCEITYKIENGVGSKKNII